MHQTKKGNQWYFGMKAHIGVDAESGLVHTVVGTAANAHDINTAEALLHGATVIDRANAAHVRRHVNSGLNRLGDDLEPHLHRLPCVIVPVLSNASLGSACSRSVARTVTYDNCAITGYLSFAAAYRTKLACATSSWPRIPPCHCTEPR
jgi:IS5 family transposase